MPADILHCDCTVMQQQHKHGNEQKQIQVIEKQMLMQWSATEACSVIRKTNNNNNNIHSYSYDNNLSSESTSCCSCSWHAKHANAQKQRRNNKMPLARQIIVKHERRRQQQQKQLQRTNYCNYNKINRLLIAIVGLLITLAAITTTTTTNTTAVSAATTMLAAVTATKTILCQTTMKTTTKPTILTTLFTLFIPASLIAAATLNSAVIAVSAASAPAPSALSAFQQQQRQLQQQQLFAMLSKNRQGNAAAAAAAGVGGLDVGGGERVAASDLAVAGFVPKHLLDVDSMVAAAADDASMETAGFVADDGQRYEKAVKALAAAAANNNNNNKAYGLANDSNDSGGGGVGRLFGVVGGPTDCPKECKCLDAYFDCGDKLLDRIPTLPGYVQTLDLVGNKLNNTSVLQIKNLTELIKLTLKRNQLESVPIFIELNSLKQLNLANNRIQRIDSAALEALPKLKSLDLSRNFLHAVEANYFPANNRLAHLILNSNEISTIDEDAFLHLSDLLDLELNNNRLKSLPAGVFRTLQRLRKLTLNNNQLEINWSTFRGLASLQKLFLKSNNIRALQDGVFYVMHAIETIELGHNGITSLSRQGLFNLTKLHHLSLTNNSISRIEPDTWEFTQSLISLDLSHNNISEFKPQHLDCLKRLRHLNLGHNEIQYLADNTFDCVKNLEDLNLRRNKLAWIIEDPGATPAFKALRKLKKLDLYGNNLKQIMSKSLSGLGNLETLNLGGNELATIQAGAFDHMPHLQKFSFKSMNFICDCELVWFQRWLRRNEQSTSGTQVQAENAVCGHPEELFNRQLLTLKSNELVCASSPKPTIIQEPSSQLTVRGANITMECVGISPTAASLAAADELKIKWRHENQNIRERERGYFDDPMVNGFGGGGSADGESFSTTETRIRQDSTTNQTTILGYLRLYNVSYANAGRYQCVISNAFGTTYSQRFKISIGIHPTFLQIPSNLTIDSGDTARLVCSATGDPVPEIALQKFGGSDFPAATERRLQVIREENAFIITNAKPIDTGIYTCTADSAAGEIKVNATLVVNDKPQPNIPLVKKETVVGESSVLQCLSDYAADLTQPHREWYKDNKPFHLGTLSADTERYYFTAEHELLVIVNTQSADAGHYRCEISDNSKTYTVQTELIIVKEELSQNMIVFGVVIVAAFCVLIIALVGFALLLYQRRRKALKRRRRQEEEEACQNANSTSGAPSDFVTESVGMVGVGGGGGGVDSRVALNASRASALDQTQITMLNRTLLHTPQAPTEAQRKRTHSNTLGDYERHAGSNGDIGGRNSDAYEIDGRPQHLIITTTPNYEQIMQQRNAEKLAAASGKVGKAAGDRGAAGENSAGDDVGTVTIGGDHYTLSYLKGISLPDNNGTAGNAGEHNQDHLSSKDSGTGSDTAVKHSLDDFTMTALLTKATSASPHSIDDENATTPINACTPQAIRRFNGGYRYDGLENAYAAVDDGGGGGISGADLDDADILYAATHALGVSECDVELLDFDRHRASTMRINDVKNAMHVSAMETDADADADDGDGDVEENLPNERTHFLHSNNCNYDYNSSERYAPTAPNKLQYPYNSYKSDGWGGGGGSGSGKHFLHQADDDGGGVVAGVNVSKAASSSVSCALVGNCDANLSTKPTNMVAHAQTVDI